MLLTTAQTRALFPGSTYGELLVQTEQGNERTLRTLNRALNDEYISPAFIARCLRRWGAGGILILSAALTEYGYDD